LRRATVEALITAARRKDGLGEDKLIVPAFEAVAEAEALTREEVVRRIRNTGTSNAERQDALLPGPLLARLAKVSIADDLPLLSHLMERFGDAKGPEAEFIVDGVLNVPGQQADARLVNWFRRYESQQPHLIIGMLGRSTIQRATLERLVLGVGARPRMLFKIFTKAPDSLATVRAYLAQGRIEQRLAAAELGGLLGDPGLRGDLRGLLRFHDARYYPSDGLIRHAAMSALVRIALRSTRPAAPAAPAAEASASGADAPAAGDAPAEE
jgi:hypothetical protein